MTDQPLEERVRVLEQQVHKMTKDETTRRSSRIRAFLLTNWTLLSFLTAIAIAAYVKLSYGIDYFENYRNAAATKSMSDYYRKMGDQMLGQQNCAAAEQAYREATKLNANNVAAQYGLIKSTVFQPPDNASFVDPLLVERRLTFLRKSLPDDPEIDYLQGWNEIVYRSDPLAAIDSLKAAIKKKADFAAAYDLLGYAYMREFRYNDERAAYAHAVQIDPRSANARRNLGWTYLNSCDFHRAVAELRLAEQISPSLGGQIALSEALLFDGHPEESTTIIHDVTETMEAADPTKDSAKFGGQWSLFYTSINRCKGDFDNTIIIATSIESKRAIAHLTFALVSAATQRLSTATRELSLAIKHDPSPNMRQFCLNHLRALPELFVVTPATKAWLAKKSEEIQSTVD